MFSRKDRKNIKRTCKRIFTFDDPLQKKEQFRNRFVEAKQKGCDVLTLSVWYQCDNASGIIEIPLSQNFISLFNRLGKLSNDCELSLTGLSFN